MIKYDSVLLPIHWALGNSGKFTYGKNSSGYAVVNGVSATVDAITQWPFQPSEYKAIERIDDSVVRIIGKGNYVGTVPGLGGVVTYHGYLDVEVNGTGDVRVLRGKFDF